MKKIILCSLATLFVSNCASIPSFVGGATNMTGEAWYVKNMGLPGGMASWSTSVWYCPAPSGGKPAECKEAKVIEDTAVAAKK